MTNNKYDLYNFIVSERRYEEAMWAVGNDEAAEAASHRIREAEKRLEYLESLDD